MSIFNVLGGEAKRLRAKVQALEEGYRDLLVASTQLKTNSSSQISVVDKNNYKTYDAQVRGAYDMYMSLVNFGSEILHGIVDMRVAMLGGEGISYTSNNEKTLEFIEKFFGNNRLSGSKWIEFLETGELEGKVLLVLSRVEDKLIVEQYCYNDYKYQAYYKNGEYKKAVYTDEDGKEQIVNSEKSVYVKLGGTAGTTHDKINQTTNRLHCVLTDIENYSRAKFDLRKNAHLFGKIMLSLKVGSKAEADSANNALNAGDFGIGKTYIGTGELELKGPPSDGLELLIKDMLTALKNISTTTGIPIHWFGYPELMSNRATAENMLEIMNAATKKDRLIWEESLTDLVNKAMQLSIDNGLEDNSIIDEFTIKVPFVSIEALKSITETWLLLWQEKLISTATIMNLIPGIDPAKELEQIQKETEEAIKNNPIQNNTVKTLLDEARNSGDGEDDPDEENQDKNMMNQKGVKK